MENNQGVAAKAAGLSQVEPLRVSPLRASIPNAVRRSAPVYMTETAHARLEHYARHAGLSKSAFLRLLIQKGFVVWQAEKAPTPPTLAGRVMLQRGDIQEGLLFAALGDQWRLLRDLGLPGSTRMWIRPAHSLERDGLAVSRYRPGLATKEYRLTAQGIEARQGGDANAAPSRSDESPVAEGHAPQGGGQ